MSTLTAATDTIDIVILPVHRDLLRRMLDVERVDPRYFTAYAKGLACVGRMRTLYVRDAGGRLRKVGYRCDGCGGAHFLVEDEPYELPADEEFAF